MDIMILIQIIVAVVAVYGAVFSTITFVSRKKEKKRQLEIKFSNGFLMYGQEPGEFVLFVEVSNPGYRDVTINIPSLILPDKKVVAFIDPYQSDVRFPHKLAEGTNCKVWTEMRDLAQNLKEHGYSGIIEINAKVEDGAGNIYRSRKPWKLNVDEWSTK